MKRSITVTMYYPGAVISVNHYMGRRGDGGTYVKREARDWMEGLGWSIKTAHIEDWIMPIKVLVSGTFKDNRSCPDVHNLLKVVCDSIEELTGINDKFYRTETGDAIIDNSVEPTLTITIEEVTGQSDPPAI